MEFNGRIKLGYTVDDKCGVVAQVNCVCISAVVAVFSTKNEDGDDDGIHN